MKLEDIITNDEDLMNIVQQMDDVPHDSLPTDVDSESDSED